MLLYNAAAPVRSGKNIVGGYTTYSGTSMATPHVTGAAALCESINPTLSARQIRDAILNTKALTGSLTGVTITGGRLDINAMATYCRPSVLASSINCLNSLQIRRSRKTRRQRLRRRRIGES